jgi:phospholipid/cholesterol/gamma-HCH transport system substrate-binding protein
MRSDAARVGITLLVAAAMLVVGTFSLRSTLRNRDTYTQKVAFTNAQGIQEGAYVRVRGVDMGTVEKIGLGSMREAVLTLRVKEEYKIRPDDLIRIVPSLVGFNPPFVEITPGGRRGSGPAIPAEVLVGDSGTSSEEIMAEGNRLIKNLNQLTAQMVRVSRGLTDLMEDKGLQRDLRRTTSNFAKISESGVVIARNMEGTTANANRLVAGFQRTASSLDHTLRQADALMTSFRRAAGDTQGLMRDSRALVRDTRSTVKDAGELMRSSTGVVKNTGELVTDLRGAFGENREKVTQLLDTLNSSLKQLEGTLVETRGFLGDPQLREDLKATFTNIREATATLSKITKDVEGLTGDPEVQQNLRDTLSNLKDTVTEAGEIFKQVKSVLPGVGKTAKSVGEKISEAELNVDLLRTFESNRTRLDFNATIPWSLNTFYRLGFYDFGESNKFNVQAGQRLRNNLWTRYGIYASKISAGLDFGDRRRPTFSLDVFGVDRPQVDLRSNVRIAPYLDLTLGLDSITGRVDPLLGLRYKK